MMAAKTEWWLDDVVLVGEGAGGAGDGGAAKSRRRAATMAWPRRRPEVGEEVVRGREMEMPGSKGIGGCARDFDPLI